MAILDSLTTVIDVDDPLIAASEFAKHRIRGHVIAMVSGVVKLRVNKTADTFATQTISPNS